MIMTSAVTKGRTRRVLKLKKYLMIMTSAFLTSQAQAVAATTETSKSPKNQATSPK